MAWLALLLLVPVAIAVYAIRTRTVRQRQLQAVANRTGLSFQSSWIGSVEVKGAFRGRPVVMTPTSPRRSPMKRNRVLLVVDLKNPEFLRLRMRRQDPTRRAFRAAEFEIGDKAFDGRFFIQSDEPALVKQVIRRDELRDALIRSDIWSAQILGPKLHIVYEGELDDPAQLELVFSAAADLGDAIDALTRNEPANQNSV
jgi:hypothetical protein